MKQTPYFTASSLVAGYDKKIIVNNIDIIIPKNKISVIIGANACGKSTLLKTMARLIKPVSGEVILDGKQISEIAPKQLARKLGLLPQSPVVPEGITVSDLVSRGRFPYQSFLKGMGKKDYEAVKEALDIMGITELANRSVDELSGGQRQRVWIAMALAQQTDILLLDEPTTFLDITYQVEILDLLTDLNQKRGTTIVMVLHDINLSARYADYIFAVKKGELISQGTPFEVITEEQMKQVFELDCAVIKDPVSGSPFIVPKGRHYVMVNESIEINE
ncbi:iron complex transport system ATP-binding protein [Lachnotalea glycerini]|uniref:Iron complex transport system ATP-binding protein n=1 Tax=Lachnotalea glycerini TaxID=1763509 RepID=A0A318ET87_9FIRM|nr:ABC transporter ATP-binding protein [Lachnotalea glycerini]PXV91601.1 iron complex transport system ATP-binding protein [Lachnotalea glycerini]